MKFLIFLCAILLMSACGRGDNDRNVFKECINIAKNVLGPSLQFPSEVKFDNNSQGLRETKFQVTSNNKKSDIICFYAEDFGPPRYYVDDIKVEIDGMPQPNGN